MLFAALSTALPPPPLYAYLCGSVWDLTKRLEYQRGGAFGTWTGQASFAPASDFGAFHLLYNEQGSIVFDAAVTSFESAGRPLCYDCAASKCFFVEGKTYVSPPPGEGMPTLRFFHDLPLGKLSADVEELKTTASFLAAATSEELPCSFEHLCVRDLYRGKFLVQDEDHFEIRWRVEGPTKMGTVLQKYTRQVNTIAHRKLVLTSS
jgi:hypothetical protein